MHLHIHSIRQVCPAILAAVLSLACLPAAATPLQFFDSKGPSQFADGTIITVYIPPDPTGGGREKDLAAGILSWNGERPLISHGIQIQVKSGQAPAGAQNAVQVNWTAPANGASEGEAGPLSQETTKGNVSIGGEMNVDPNPANVNHNMAKNLGIHEMGHVLGLDDLPNSGTAMDPNFNKNSTVKITDEDTLELFSTFAASNGPSSDHASVDVHFDHGLYTYTYTLNWSSGIDLALFQVDTDYADIQDVVTPTGWAFDSPDGSDVLITEASPPQNQQFASFVLRDGISYLGPDNPVLTFSFESPTPPGDAQAFLSGTFDTIGPVPTPELQPLLLTLTGVAALVCKRRSRPGRPQS